MEEVTEEQAAEAAQVLSKTLQRRRLLNVDVEVIIAEESFIVPYKHDTRAPDADDEALLAMKDHQPRKTGKELPSDVHELLNVVAGGGGRGSGGIGDHHYVVRINTLFTVWDGQLVDRVAC